MSIFSFLQDSNNLSSQRSLAWNWTWIFYNIYYLHTYESRGKKGESVKLVICSHERVNFNQGIIL